MLKRIEKKLSKIKKTIVTKLEEMKLFKAAKVVEDGTHETLGYMKYPEKHWRRIRTNNPLERINKEI